MILKWDEEIGIIWIFQRNASLKLDSSSEKYMDIRSFIFLVCVRFLLQVSLVINKQLIWSNRILKKEWVKKYFTGTGALSKYIMTALEMKQKFLRMDCLN